MHTPARTFRFRSGLAGFSFMIAGAAGLSPAAALPSLSGTDRDEIPVTIGKLKATVIVIRDVDDRDQWYYVPDTPRLAEVAVVKGGTMPQFSMVRYQYNDPADNNNILEKGLVQFAVSMALPEDAVKQVKAKLQQKHKAENRAAEAKLTALPIKKATVEFYSPAGELLSGEPAGNGLAPQFSTQKIAFSIALTRVGARVVDELMRGSTGLPVRVTYSYVGKLPPAGFKIKVSRSQLFKHYSENTKVAATASYLGLFSASYNKEDSQVIQDMIKSNIVSITRDSGESMTDDEMTTYIAPVLKLVNEDLLQPLSPPPQVTPAQASSPTANAKYLSVGYSRATKKVEQKDLSDFEYDFHGTRTQEQSTIASGFVGVGSYPKAVQEAAVTIVPTGPQTTATFLAPVIDPETRLSQADVTIRLINADGSLGNQYVMVWTADKQAWTDIQGRPIKTSLVIPTLSESLNANSREKTRFQVQTRLTTKQQSIAFSETVQGASGETTLATPQTSITNFVVNPISLSWQKTDPTSKLAAVQVNFVTGNDRRAFTITPKGDAPAEPVNYLMAVGPGGAVTPSTVQVVYYYAGGQKPKTVYSGAVNDVPGFPMLMLTDE